MTYSFATPQGWSRSPFPPPQRGVYLRAPVVTPSPEAASILLFDAVAAAGTMDEHLASFVKQGCESAKIAKHGKPGAFKTRAFSGVAQSLVVQVPAPMKEEVRIFYLVDCGSERLPVAFVGGSKALAKHQASLDALIQSIGP